METFSKLQNRYDNMSENFIEIDWDSLVEKEIEVLTEASEIEIDGQEIIYVKNSKGEYLDAPSEEWALTSSEIISEFPNLKVEELV